MASSPLPFPFPPTTTSYRAGAIFKFEMCQSAPRHPVHTAELPVPQPSAFDVQKAIKSPRIDQIPVELIKESLEQFAVNP